MSPRWRPLLWLMLLLFWLGGPRPVWGQAPGWVRLGPLQTEAFPRLTLFVQPFDGSGRFVGGLAPADFAVYEDARPVPVLRATVQHPGVQVVVALAPGRAFSVRDALGVSRYEYIALQLLSWAHARRGTSLDDLSLVSLEGVHVSHNADYSQLIQALSVYRPPERPPEPTLAPLTQALTLAADPTPRPGMGRVVLFITAPLPEGQRARLPDLTHQAQQAGISVYPWLVAPPEEAQGATAEALRQLAVATGGRFTFFSGEETLPVVADLLAPHALTYRLDYLSAARESGPRRLRLSVRTPEGVLEAPPLSYDLTVLPPHPVVLDLPAVIERPVPLDDPGRDPALREPRALVLPVSVEFPDGHARPLRRLALLVDGQTVAVRTEPPFDQVRWDLRAYTQSGEHTLVLEAEDNLGLVGRGEAVGVRLVVPPPPDLATTLTLRYGPWLTYGVLTGIGLLLLWVVLSPQGRRAAPDTARRLARWARRQRQRAPAQPSAPSGLAQLVPLSRNGHPAPALTLTTSEAVLGSDPQQADLVVEDPSVAPRHARWWRDAAGRFRIADLGSLAGTWVNYTPLPARSQEGQVLQPGDIVHLGRVGFRFVLSQGPLPRPQVLPWPDTRAPAAPKE